MGNIYITLEINGMLAEGGGGLQDLLDLMGARKACLNTAEGGGVSFCGNQLFTLDLDVFI